MFNLVASFTLTFCPPPQNIIVFVRGDDFVWTPDGNELVWLPMVLSIKADMSSKTVGHEHIDDTNATIIKSSDWSH